MKMKFKKGVMFTERGKKHNNTWRVVDYYTTRNIEGRVVSCSYLAEKQFMGQVITKEFCPTSVSMGLVAFSGVNTVEEALDQQWAS